MTRCPARFGASTATRRRWSGEVTEFARSVCARQAIAHVRQATSGDVTFENTHPFVHGPWVFVHNGTIRHFDEGVKERMWPEIAPDHRRRIRGNTDSEAFFRLLMTRLERRPDAHPLDVVAEAIRDVVAWCVAAGPCENLGLNILLGDGRRILGARWQQSLWMLRREGRLDATVCEPSEDATPPDGYHAVLIASEPLTDEEWRRVPERSVFDVEYRAGQVVATTRPAAP